MELPSEETLLAALLEASQVEQRDKRLALAVMVAATFAADDGLTTPAFRRIADASLKWARARREAKAREIEMALLRGQRKINATGGGVG